MIHQSFNFKRISSLVLICFCLVIQNSNAQNIVDTKQTKLRIGFNYSQDYCFRKLYNTNASELNDVLINIFNNNEKYKFGLTTGFHVIYNINSKWEIEGGIQFSNKGYQSKTMELKPLVPELSLPQKAKTVFTFHYFDVPLKVNYVFFKKHRLQWFASSAIINHFLIQSFETDKLYFENKTDIDKRKIKQYKPHNISPSIGAGFYYQINQQLSFRLEPQFKFQIFSNNSNSISEHLYNFGLNWSLNMKIGS